MVTRIKPPNMLAGIETYSGYPDRERLSTGSSTLSRMHTSFSDIYDKIQAKSNRGVVSIHTNVLFWSWNLINRGVGPQPESRCRDSSIHYPAFHDVDWSPPWFQVFEAGSIKPCHFPRICMMETLFPLFVWSLPLILHWLANHRLAVMPCLSNLS